MGGGVPHEQVEQLVREGEQFGKDMALRELERNPEVAVKVLERMGKERRDVVLRRFQPKNGWLTKMLGG